MRHFLDIRDFTKSSLGEILQASAVCKEKGDTKELVGKRVALLFEQASTRTRVSFDVGIHALGGSPVILDSNAMHLSEGETLEDTARVLSRYVDGIVIRSLDHDKVVRLSEVAGVPVINALTRRSHPCQLIADLLTIKEKKGSLDSFTCTWLGAVNNMTNSWIDAAIIFGFKLRVVVPTGFGYEAEAVERAKFLGGDIEILSDASKGVLGADVVTTDTWASLGGKGVPKEELEKKFGAYRVDEKLMAQAKPDAIFLHCLPAYRGCEVSADVIDGAQSVVWDEAENRLHAHKGILLYCMEIV